jgi:hypothetical protein
MSPYGKPIGQVKLPIPRRLRPTRWITQVPFPAPSRYPHKTTPQHGVWEVFSGVMSEGCPGVTSEEHVPWGLIWVLFDVLDELDNRFTHQVWFIDLELIRDGGHVFLEGQRHPQASLVRVFGHRHFLSSFWILVITRLTVSSIRSSFSLLDRGLFVRPHKGLVSCSCWSFFIGYSPAKQSLQEYLGGLVQDPFRWILENILKGNSRVKSWCECLEVVISGHTEPTQGTAWPLESSDFRDISNQRNLPNQ